MIRLATAFFLQMIVLLAQAKPVEIVLWHSLAGHLGQEMQQLTNTFNQQQPDYLIKPVYKGEYTEAITSFAAAFHAHQPPAIVQIFEVGTATMQHPKGIIKPVDELMREQGLDLPVADFMPAVRNFYSNAGRLVAMPFNTSIPVIYYNADELSRLGYDENSFPQTWDEMEQLAVKLKAAGFECAYTTAYPAWIQIESFSALHGLAMINKKGSKTSFNNAAIISHLKRLKRWQQKHFFEYGGRASDATILFTSGRCALFSQSSGSHNSLAELVKFHMGVANMPLDNRASIVRHNNVIGGAAFWAVAGQTPKTNKGVAQFFSYLAQAQVQQKWHQHTGYLPLGVSGIYASFMQDSKRHPILALMQQDLQKEESTRSNQGPQNLIRTINDEALEMIFAGIKSPEAAINEAARRADYALMRFSRNVNHFKN